MSFGIQNRGKVPSRKDAKDAKSEQQAEGSNQETARMGQINRRFTQIIADKGSEISRSTEYLISQKLNEYTESDSVKL